MSTRNYSVGELRRIVEESADYFKPIKGLNVDSENKKNNEKAYKDTESKVNTYDGGKSNKTKKIKYPNSDNKGMQDLEYENMDKSFADRVKSQMKGYTSTDAEKKHKNNEYGNADFTEIEGADDRAKSFKNGKDVASEIGLTGRELNPKDIEKQSKTIYNENKLLRLNFKNTTFISEGHMMTKIPDDYKTEGRKFIMKDKVNTEYIVEWHNEDKPKVMNITKMNEQNQRIKDLSNYKSETSKTTNKSRTLEESNFNDMLGKVRSLMN